MTSPFKMFKVNTDGSGLTELKLNIPGSLGLCEIAVNRKEKRICFASKGKRHDINAVDRAYVHMRLNVMQNHSSGYYTFK